MLGLGAIPLVKNIYLLAPLAVMAVLIALAVRELVLLARRSLRDSRAGRIPGPEAERFREGEEQRLTRDSRPEDGEDHG